MIQVHAIGRYAEESQQSSKGWARSYVHDYFRMPGKEFNRRYFPREMQSLKRPTSKEQYAEIVQSLGNQTQEQIVTAPKDGNLLVLAGPGSGKTRVVVHRAAYLLMVERIRPERLLVICFNRSAMHELRVRLRELVGDLAGQVAVHTYHSLALRVTERSIAERVKAAGDNTIDFDEIIKEANHRLAGREQIVGAAPDELRDRLLSGFEYVLVDEYQDIDDDQYEMITHIARRAGQEGEDDRRATILAVGDDDQNIYEWRHANVRYLKRFEKDFEADRHYLVENYRSTRRIIDASNELIRHNQDRMKVDNPIRINAARERDPPGGPWQKVDRRIRGRVSRIEVEETGVPATTLGEIERLRKLDPHDWKQFAVLAWTHAQLAPVRALLEKEGVPVRRSIPDGLPRLERIREFRLLLDRLTTNQNPKISLPRLRRQLVDACGAEPNGHHWLGMADQMLAHIQAGAPVQPVPVMDVTEAVRQALADHNRSHLIGRGVLVSTIHSAKGLEFDHVLLLGGLRGNHNTGRIPNEEERRLYYVGMTRACRTLALIDSLEKPNPYFAEVRSNVRRRRARVAQMNPGPNQGLTYQVLGMKDLWLDFAGRQHSKHEIHRALSQLQAGDRVSLKPNHNGQVSVVNHENRRVALLSRPAARQWPASRIRRVDEIRVLGMVHRTKDDSDDPKYRKQLRVDSWEIPILEAREPLDRRPRP